MLMEQYGLGSLCTGNQGRKEYIPFNKHVDPYDRTRLDKIKHDGNGEDDDEQELK